MKYKCGVWGDNIAYEYEADTPEEAARLFAMDEDSNGEWPAFGFSDLEEEFYLHVSVKGCGSFSVWKETVLVPSEYLRPEHQDKQVFATTYHVNSKKLQE